MNEHEHDDPGWSPDCHDCHIEGIGDTRSCDDCRAAAREDFREAARQVWEDTLEVQRATQRH